MELSEGKPVDPDLPAAAAKAILRLTAQQRQELELLYRQCPRPNSSLLQQFIKDRPLLSNLDKHNLKAWFQSRRLKEKRDEKLSPLIHKNANLKAEHETLILLNNRLRNQTLLLNLENQRLKEQLELQKKQSSASSSLTSLDAVAHVIGSRDFDDDDGKACESGLCDLETNLNKVKLT